MKTESEMAISKFRDALAAMGYNPFLLTDAEVWEWAERLVAPLVKNHEQLQQAMIRLGRQDAG